MLDEQERQVNKRDVTVFEKDTSASTFEGKGFNWSYSKDGYKYWHKIIIKGKYPKEPKEEPKKYPRIMMVSGSMLYWEKRVVEL